MIKIENKIDVVLLQIHRRGRIFNPEGKTIIINTSTGKQIKDVFPVNINREPGVHKR